ncbi:hypothetical protein EVAR_47612_1 [Eumeta japonica]|uniref:Uncharacterized protein n=1 Tax=Eumeta variegata TaxID=151549 RepID=A0A4C1WS59_EUMVA|nr:hypothetical protein EVAR_47612_1 [Eumeta japonica]
MSALSTFDGSFCDYHGCLGNGESGFDSEREPETATTSKKAAGAQITHSRHGELHLCAACRCTAPAVQLTRLRSISSVNRSGAGLVSVLGGSIFKSYRVALKRVTRWADNFTLNKLECSKRAMNAA